MSEGGHQENTQKSMKKKRDHLICLEEEITTAEKEYTQNDKICVLINLNA